MFGVRRIVCADIQHISSISQHTLILSIRISVLRKKKNWASVTSDPVPGCIRKSMLWSCSSRSLSATNMPYCSFVVFPLRGRFSVVNLCRDAETSQVFVAKITPYQAEQRQLVLREYQLLKRLHHPHLVQLHTAYFTSCYLVLVEELCPGKELLYSLASRYTLYPVLRGLQESKKT